MTSVRRYASISLLNAAIVTALSAQAVVAGEYATAQFTGSRADRCAAYGPDFASVQGSDACVRIGGRLRVQVGGNTGLFGKPTWPAGHAAAASLRLDKQAEPSHLRVRGDIGYPNPFH